ncbi:MAG: hypothetical protein ACK4UK_03985 [Flavobacterium sp.]
MKEKQIAIITADIIDSTEIHFSNREALFAKFNEGLEIVKKDFDVEIEWYRGDAFQAKITTPTKWIY